MERAIFILFITMPAISCQICMSCGRLTVNSCVNVGVMGPHTHTGNISSGEKLCHNSESFHNLVPLMFFFFFLIWSFLIVVVHRVMDFDWILAFQSCMMANIPETWYIALVCHSKGDLWKFCSQTIIIGMFLCSCSRSKDSDSHGEHKTWQAGALNL